MGMGVFMSAGTQMIADLTAEDRFEISEIFAKWARYEDSGNSEGWANLFTRDGSYVSAQGKLAQGYDQLVKKSKERWSKPESRLAIHWFGDPVIHACAEGAEASHYGMIIHKTSDGYEMHDPSIRSYVLHKEDGRWKIARRGIQRLPLL
jgi:uncharacterized protein (TIGR02246 family)